MVGDKGGAGGSRTLVQTGKPYAFYMLIPDFVFVLQQDQDHQLQPYPLKFYLSHEATADYSRFSCTAWPTGFGTTSC